MTILYVVQRAAVDSLDGVDGASAKYVRRTWKMIGSSTDECEAYRLVRAKWKSDAEVFRVVPVEVPT